MKPFTIPNLESSTFATGARQFVVQEAFEIISSFFGSYVFSLTPRTICLTGLSPLGGAESTTFFAPAFRCNSACSLLRNIPVDSITISIPIFPHGRFEGSFSENIMILFPFTEMKFSPALILPLNLP